MSTLRNIQYGLFHSLAITVAGCAQKSRCNYFPDEAGKTMPVESASVISQRKVTIKGLRENETRWGAIVGATNGTRAPRRDWKRDSPTG